MYRRITDYFAYRWRYLLGYLSAIVVIAGMLTVAALFVPHELRQAEIDSAVTSGTLGTQSMAPETVINLPYHILQKASFIAFGVTTFSIKLPSIILGTLTVLGIFLLLKTWFHERAAILAATMSVITAQFLFLFQDGTPLIMFSFVTVWLLFVATYVTRRKRFGLFWKVMTTIAMAMSLYTPLGIYLVLVMLAVSLFHPHIRYLLKRLNPYLLTIAILMALASLIPLGYAIYLKPSVLGQLVGIPVNLTLMGLWTNLLAAFKDTLGFASISHIYLLRPLYPLGVALLMTVGLYNILTKRYTARSSITLVWGLVISVFIIINPQYITYTFPVAVILSAYGITYMFQSWYRLFPRNPYARVLGIIPLSVLIIATVAGGAVQYVDTYHYNPDILGNYSNDLNLLHEQLALRDVTKSGSILLVAPSEEPFYHLVQRYDNRINVTTDAGVTGPLIIATHLAATHAKIPAEIVVSPRATDADRFYIYTK